MDETVVCETTDPNTYINSILFEIGYRLEAEFQQPYEYNSRGIVGEP